MSEAENKNLSQRLDERRERISQALEAPGLFWVLIIISLILLAIAIIIFGNSESYVTPDLTPAPSEARQSRTYTVIYRNGVFSPTNLRIHAGDTVRFRNEDFDAIRMVSDSHPEHDDLSSFDSVGNIPQGSFFSFTFAAKGIFGYHNENNINEVGTIIVR